MGFNGVKKPKTKSRGDLITALDVGTSKVVCVIARVEDDGGARLVGFGHQGSQGLRGGTIIDMDAAARSIGQAVEAAEQMAREQIERVTVNLSGGQPLSQTLTVDVPISGQEVTEHDLRRALKAQSQADLPADSEILHSIPVSYSVDGARGIRDPLGMFGERLGLELHLVTAAASAVRNLTTCVRRCHLDIDDFVVSAYASGLASLVPDEMELGATVVDLGAGTTNLAVFSEGRLVFTDSLPVGGAHVTNDIARGLTTPLTHAERMKVLYGTAIPSIADEREIIDVPQIGEDNADQPNHVPKSLLTGIIQPRLEEIFELVRGRLEASGFDRVSGRRVVLTGGASQLQGLRELAQLVLDKQVRMGRPTGVENLPDHARGPAFAGVAGLVAHALRNPAEAMAAGVDDMAAQGGGLLNRLGGWFREHL
ncbi:MAG: cell division protein FtsA [Azospirillaceae bacterium]